MKTRRPNHSTVVAYLALFGVKGQQESPLVAR